MKRIVVIGCSGSGKSTFSRKLKQVTGNPLHHLDKLYWLPDWNLRAAEEQDRIQKERIKDEKMDNRRQLPTEPADSVGACGYSFLFRLSKEFVSLSRVEADCFEPQKDPS